MLSTVTNSVGEQLTVMAHEVAGISYQQVERGRTQLTSITT
ncbi:hypothetical protein FBHYGVHD_CDS0033 [Staphylococcus phage MVC_VPHSA1]|uniref:Uncharacterized protein n=1 Tax=Staphylococcus phage MVC_VPHSA1 TaxID=3088876 RepID=A0ABZ0QYJ9_9CAUD|nr:hypothetical protein FBHYGVHD_CDS0033 [Staphylococcus phage MVC_VPHSA1]